MTRRGWLGVIALEVLCVVAGAYLYREAFTGPAKPVAFPAAAATGPTPRLVLGKPAKSWNAKLDGHRFRCQAWIFGDGFIERCVLRQPAVGAA